MIQKYFFFTIYIVLLLIPIISMGGNTPDYKIENISETLKKNSKAVIRYEYTLFEVYSTSKAKKTIKRIISILNENGLKNSEFIEYYNSFTKIKNLEGVVYDKDGKKVKELSGKDIKDYSAISGFSVYDDNRVKFIDPDYRVYPFTVEYNYDIEYEGLLNFPSWTPYQDYNVSVENSIFRMIVPKDFKFRHLEKNYNGEVQITENEGKITYTWVADYLESITPQTPEKSFIENYIFVKTAPNEFVFNKQAGTQDTWKDFGEWIHNLNIGRTVLDPQTQSKVLELIKDAKSDEEKVKILYTYMQSKTRYVSVQVGIGGWQPFPASDVDRLNYGDCKALSNYMKALLDVAEIKSHYTLVLAGEDEPNIQSQFPSNQFNHAIICVPFATDTLWLECTSQTIAAGYLGTFTDDRDVLIIDNNGGKLARTQKYSANENIISKKTTVDLNISTPSLAHMETSFIGLACDMIYPISRSDAEDRKKQLYNSLALPSFNIQSITYNEVKSRIPRINEVIELSLNNYLNKLTDDKYLVKPEFFKRFATIPPKITLKTNSIYIKRESIETDTLIYNLPTGFEPAKLPNDISIKSDFGTYDLQYKTENNKIFIIRKLFTAAGDFDKSMWNDYQKFYQDIYVSDNKPLSINKLK